MTSLPPAVRSDNSHDAAISSMKGAMAAASVKQDELLVAEQRLYLGKTNGIGVGSHLFQKLVTPTQSLSSSGRVWTGFCYIVAIRDWGGQS